MSGQGVNQPWVQGAVGMARYWLRNPETMTDAGFEQVCSELCTISRALAYLAAARHTEAAEQEETG